MNLFRYDEPGIDAPQTKFQLACLHCWCSESEYIYTARSKDEVNRTIGERDYYFCQKCLDQYGVEQLLIQQALSRL